MEEEIQQTEATKEEKFYGPNVYKRNEHGLLENVEYVFNPDGSVNWRAMIKPEFLFIRKEWFEARKQEVPTSPEGLSDNQLAIMLGGIKELAKLRGYSSVNFNVQHVEKNYVVARCSINWNENYETGFTDYKGGILYEEYGNATAENTNDFCLKFLETIACNRAFVRCVRNFLNIHIVGVDELDKSQDASSQSPEESNSNTSLSPASILEKTVSKKLKTDFNGFKQGFLKTLWKSEAYRNEDAANWNSFDDIPAKEARKLLALVKKAEL